MDWVIRLIWVVMILKASLAAKERSQYHQDDKLIKQLLNKTIYSKSEPPAIDATTEVKIGIYVNSFYSISELSMEYTVSLYLRQNWQDKRLQYDQRNKKQLRVGEEHFDDIWVPDTFFRNEKTANFHQITVENKLMKLNSSGFVWYVAKITATLSCPMRLQNYPMDTQYCPMLFESFGYTMDTMYYSWLPSPVALDPNIALPEFTLLDFILYDCSQNYSAGAFPCLEIQFVLQREIGFYLINIYIPTLLTVMLSWSSFWIDKEAVECRVSIGLITILTMSTTSTGALSSLPRVSYVKAIDVWFATCLLFVFCGLLQFVLVNFVSRKQIKARTNIKQERHLNPTGEPNEKEIMVNYTDVNIKPKQGIDVAKQIDRISRLLFPIAFLVFNIIYWVLYSLSAPKPGSLSLNV